jgi:hypothetical protein
MADSFGLLGGQDRFCLAIDLGNGSTMLLLVAFLFLGTRSRIVSLLTTIGTEVVLSATLLFSIGERTPLG